MSRRTALLELGGGLVGAFVLVGCSSGGSGSASSSTAESVDPGSESPAGSQAEADRESGVDEDAEIDGVAEPGRWERVDMGFVSAYVLVRGGEAVVVDTGPSGNERAIEAALAGLSVGWSDISDVILTHRHPDHVGSLGAIVDQAPNAALWTGAADLDAIGQDLGLVGVVDGDEIAGLQVIGTPGHTAGHISILDPLSGVLVAGDAINGEGGGVVGPNPDFTDDLELANSSVLTLAEFDYDAVLFGHGEPVAERGSALVGALAEELATA